MVRLEQTRGAAGAAPAEAGANERTAGGRYRKAGRGCGGRKGQGRKDEDVSGHRWGASSHTHLRGCTDEGRGFWLRVHEIPQAGRAAKGKPVVNLINVTPDTHVHTIVPESGSHPPETTPSPPSEGPRRTTTP